MSKSAFPLPYFPMGLLLSASGIPSLDSQKGAAMKKPTYSPEEAIRVIETLSQSHPDPAQFIRAVQLGLEALPGANVSFSSRDVSGLRAEGYFNDTPMSDEDAQLLLVLAANSYEEGYAAQDSIGDEIRELVSRQSTHMPGDPVVMRIETSGDNHFDTVDIRHVLVELSTPEKEELLNEALAEDRTGSMGHEIWTALCDRGDPGALGMKRYLEEALDEYGCLMEPRFSFPERGGLIRDWLESYGRVQPGDGPDPS